MKVQHTIYKDVRNFFLLFNAFRIWEQYSRISRLQKQLKIPPHADFSSAASAGVSVAAILLHCKMKWTQANTLILVRENGNIRINLEAT